MAKQPQLIKPLHEEWLINFMKEVEITKKNKTKFTKAILKYQRRCLKAAEDLGTDLEKILDFEVKQ
jgi:hypothetical protein